MNLKSFVITTAMFFVVLPQSITTEKTIKPIVEIPTIDETYKKTFIGFEGEGIFKKAQLYGLTTKNTIKQLPNFQFILPEEDTNYFVSGLYGDISGEGQKDFILILANPNSGTRLYTWTIDENNQFSRLTKPYKIKKNQTESYPTTSLLATVYPDKDQEIVLSFGSPDRKIIILDYIGEIKQTETIGKDFLSNLAGPIILKTKDLNNDNLDDLYIINNGEKIVESFYLSPNRKAENTNNRTKRILDLYLYGEDNKTEKIFLLQEQKLFFDKWKKEIDIDFKNPKSILLVKNNTLSIINKQGQIQHYTINNQTETLKKKNLVTPNFKNKNFNNTHHLLLNDQENILLSHDKQSEILLQPLYYNLAVEETKTTNTLKTEKTKKETTKGKTKQTNESSKKTAENKNNEKKEIKTKQKQEEKPQTIILSQDTIAVNVGQEASIEIKLKDNYIFLDLKTNKKPKQMQFDVKQLSFLWLPTNKELGYHTLQYDITYNKNTGIKKEEVEGKLRIINETEKIKETKNHIIFVNAPPSIKTDQTKHYREAQHELQIKLNISDRNKEQKLYTTHKFLADKTAKIQENIFSWTPQNKHYGENKINFFVYDGMLYDSTFIIVEVDTLRQEIVNKDLIIATVNKELIYRLPQNKKTQYSIVKGLQNMRVSKKGTLHWIPINTQLGYNKIIIENKEINQSYNYSMDVFVNAPPVISYRPDDIEFINYEDVFNFQFQSFDQNNNQELFWSLSKGPKNMKFNEANLEWKGNKLDYNQYTIELTDTIDQDTFNGTIYVNEIPQLINTPPKHIALGDTLNYSLDIKDNNQINPLNGKKEKHTTVTLLTFPKNMKVKNNSIQWTPTINDIGEHNITLEISDGIEKTENKFNVFVNDAPQIISTDSLKIQVGDTLRHILKAKDLNQNTKLTYSISSNLNNMMLNAQTGEITWIPTIEDLGSQEITVNVSDGLISNKKNQTIQIFVYALPKFIKGPPKESYINIEYNHTIEAQDGFGKNIPGKDIYVKVDSTTLNNISFNAETNRLSMVPTIEQTGDQEITLELKDNYNNIIKEKFIISVLISPCETADSLHYNKTQSLEKKVNEYEKVIQIIESPTTTIDTLYSINYSKRELRKKTRQEKRNKQKAEKELRKKNRNKTTTKQDTTFITEYDTLYQTTTDTIYNKIKIQEKKPLLKEAEEQKKNNKIEENKTTEEQKKPEEPITRVRKQTIIIDKKQTIIIDDKTTIHPPPYGQKTGYNKIFEEQKWGQAGIKKTQKTSMQSTVLAYKKNWR